MLAGPYLVAWVLHALASSYLSDAANSEQTERTVFTCILASLCPVLCKSLAPPFPGFPVPPGLSPDLSLLFLKLLGFLVSGPFRSPTFFLFLQWEDNFIHWVIEQTVAVRGWLLCVFHSYLWLPTFLCASAGIHLVSPLSWHAGKVTISNIRLILLNPTELPLPAIISNNNLFLLQNLQTLSLLVLYQFSNISTNSHPWSNSIMLS